VPYQFRGLESIAVGPNNRLYISESNSNYQSISIYDTSRHYIERWNNVHGFIRFDPDGHLWVNDSQHLREFDNAGNEIASMNAPQSFCFLGDRLVTLVNGDTENSIHWYDLATLQEEGSFASRDIYAYNRCVGTDWGKVALITNRNLQVFDPEHPGIEDMEVFHPDLASVYMSMSIGIFNNGLLWTCDEDGNGNCQEIFALDRTTRELFSDDTPWSPESQEQKIIPVGIIVDEAGQFEYQVTVDNASGLQVGAGSENIHALNQPCALDVIPDAPVFLSGSNATATVKVTNVTAEDLLDLRIQPYIISDGQSLTLPWVWTSAPANTTVDVPLDLGKEWPAGRYFIRAILAKGSEPDEQVYGYRTATYTVVEPQVDCRVEYPEYVGSNSFNIKVVCSNKVAAPMDLKVKLSNKLSKNLHVEGLGSSAVTFGPLSIDKDTNYEINVQGSFILYQKSFTVKTGLDASLNVQAKSQYIAGLIEIPVQVKNTGHVPATFVVQRKVTESGSGLDVYTDTISVSVKPGRSVQEMLDTTVEKTGNYYVRVSITGMDKSSGADFNVVPAGANIPWMHDDGCFGVTEGQGVVVNSQNQGYEAFKGHLSVSITDAKGHGVFHEKLPVVIGAQQDYEQAVQVPQDYLVPGDFTADMTLLDFAGKVAAHTGCLFTVHKPQVSVKIPSAGVICEPGKTVDMALTLTHYGAVRSLVSVRGEVLDASKEDVMNLVGDSSVTFHLPFTVPKGLPKGQNFARFTITPQDNWTQVNPKQVLVPLIFPGAGLDAVLSLDKPAYAQGEPAVLHVQVLNSGQPVDVDLRFMHDNQHLDQHAVINGQAVFDFPFTVTKPGGTAGLTIVDTINGTNLLIDYALIHKKGGIVHVRSDKDDWVPDETINFMVSADKDGVFKALVDGFGDARTLTLTHGIETGIDFHVPPDCPAGVYTMAYDFTTPDGAESGTYRFKVKAPHLVIKQMNTAKATYAPGDDVLLHMVIRSDKDRLPNLVVYDIPAAGSAWNKVYSKMIWLPKGYNTIDRIFSASAQAGDHKILAIVQINGLTASSTVSSYNVGGFAIRGLRLPSGHVEACADNLKLTATLWNTDKDLKILVGGNGVIKAQGLVHGQGIIKNIFDLGTFPAGNIQGVVIAGRPGDSDLEDWKPFSFDVTDTLAPVIIANCTESGMYIPPFVIKFQASDCSDFDLTGILDGTEVQSGFEVTQPGMHTLYITATDTWGNSARRVLNFYVAGTNPDKDDSDGEMDAEAISQDTGTEDVQVEQELSEDEYKNDMIEDQPDQGIDTKTADFGQEPDTLAAPDTNDTKEPLMETFVIEDHGYHGQAEGPGDAPKLTDNAYTDNGVGRADAEQTYHPREHVSGGCQTVDSPTVPGGTIFFLLAMLVFLLFTGKGLGKKK